MGPHQHAACGPVVVARVAGDHLDACLARRLDLSLAPLGREEALAQRRQHQLRAAHRARHRGLVDLLHVAQVCGRVEDDLVIRAHKGADSLEHLHGGSMVV